MKKAALLAGVAAVALVLSGCVERAVSGPEITFRFERSIVALSAIGSLAMVVVALLVRRRALMLTFALLALGGVGFALVGPSLANDHVVLSDQGLDWRYGLWWSPSEHRLRFAEMAGIECLTIREQDSRGRWRHAPYLDVTDRTGAVKRYPVGDLMRRAVRDVLDRAALRGVPVKGRAAVDWAR